MHGTISYKLDNFQNVKFIDSRAFGKHKQNSSQKTISINLHVSGYAIERSLYFRWNCLCFAERIVGYD